MLNYNDNVDTLKAFYGVSDLDSPVKVNKRPLFYDTETLNAMDSTEQYTILNELLDLDLQGSHINAENGQEDPLTGQNLVRILRKKGAISSPSDPELSKFLVTSQAFNPQAYLSLVHQDASIEQLMSNLNGLDNMIRHQTSELKSVLNDNYERFLSCKKAIDDNLSAFKNLKSQAQKTLELTKVFNPASKRGPRRSNQGDTLLSELEESINNLNLSSSLMIRPIMEHNAKESKVAKLIDFVRTNQFIFDLPKKFIEYLANHNHDSFIEDYNKFLKEKEYIRERQEKAKVKAQDSGNSEAIKSLDQAHNLQNTALARVYKEVINIADEFKKKSLQELLSMDHDVGASAGGNRKLALDVKFIDLVDKLHRMNSDNSNSSSTPIKDFLNSQLKKLETEILHQHKKFCDRFSSMQQRLTEYINSLSEMRPDGSHVKHISEKFENVEEYFRASSAYTTLEIDAEKERIIVEIFGNSENLDLSIINETWSVLANFISYVEEFFDTSVSKFVKNYAHYSSPENGYNVDVGGELKDLFFKVLNDMIGRLMAIFESDIPSDQMKVTPSNYSAFLPYHTNSLSAIFFLQKISGSLCKLLTQCGKYAALIGNMGKSIDTNKQIKHLRDASVYFDQRILEAVCATWVNDCSQFYDLEDWEKYNVFGDRKMKSVIYTKLMQTLYYYELYVLDVLSLLFIRKSNLPGGDVRVVTPYPSKRILVSLEIQFMRSMTVLVDSSVKKYTSEKAEIQAAEGTGAYDTEQCIFKILTMNNFTALGDFIFPKLMQKFDQTFDKTLQKQNLKLFSNLDQVKITILDDINGVEKNWIETRIDRHFKQLENRIDGKTNIKIDPFVYDCLLHFVKLVHVLKPITDTGTFVTIIQQLQTHFLLKFLQCIREVSQREHLIKKILGNIKLDLDFFVEVFEASETLKLDDYCLNLVQIVVAEIQKAEGIFKDLGYTADDIDQKLYKALEYSENEFTCFV